MRTRHPGVCAVLAILVAIAVGCGAESPCGRAALAPLDRTPAYAVVTGDFTSTAIALLDARGTPITGAWIDSGTTRPGLATTISGDVALPTRPVTPGVLTVIDRFGVDRITRIAVPEGNVLGQVPTTPAMRRGQTAFRANPHDAVALEGSGALVSRFEPNLDPRAAPLDRGNDLLRVDMAAGELTDRIPLGSLDVHVTGPRGEDTRVYARPSRMVRTGSRIVVGLARLSADFMVAGPGAVAIVDPVAGTARALALEGLTNCGEVVPVPRRPNRAAVVCSGPTFAEGPEGRREGAGAAWIHVPPDRAAHVAHLWRAAEHPSVPPVSRGAVAIGDTHLVVAARGSEPTGAPDRLVRLDLASGETQVVAEGDGGFVFGPGAFDSERHLLLIPDTVAGIRRFHVPRDGGAPEPMEVVDPSPCRELGAREIRPL